MCASGAKSPEAPRDPFSGINGTTFLFNISRSNSIVESLIPETPFRSELILISITPLTSSSGSGLPNPEAWVLIMFSWSWTESSLEILTLDREPKPVLIP